jgi:hypothetical protein
MKHTAYWELKHQQLRTLEIKNKSNYSLDHVSVKELS